jgi:hypothetical protein
MILQQLLAGSLPFSVLAANLEACGHDFFVLNKRALSRKFTNLCHQLYYIPISTQINDINKPVYLQIYTKETTNIWNKSGEFNFFLCRCAFGRKSGILRPTKLASRKRRLWNLHVLLNYGLRHRWKKILKQMLNSKTGRLRNGFMWLRIQASGGLLRIR